jgi:bacterioferritin-associated ferredoxin
LENWEIIDNLKVICTCKGVKKGKIIKVINEGALTVEKVWELSNSGDGSCCGRRCGVKIREMLKKDTN